MAVGCACFLGDLLGPASELRLCEDSLARSQLGFQQCLTRPQGEAEKAGRGEASPSRVFGMWVGVFGGKLLLNVEARSMFLGSLEVPPHQDLPLREV